MKASNQDLHGHPASLTLPKDGPVVANDGGVGLASARPAPSSEPVLEVALYAYEIAELVELVDDAKANDWDLSTAVESAVATLRAQLLLAEHRGLK